MVAVLRADREKFVGVVGAGEVERKQQRGLLKPGELSEGYVTAAGCLLEPILLCVEETGDTRGVQVTSMMSSGDTN